MIVNTYLVLVFNKIKYKIIMNDIVYEKYTYIS